jgi:hypothetical protein
MNNEGWTHASVSNEPTSYINRNGTDGDVVRFLKDGTTVGSIGTGSGDLNINGPAGHSGIRFQASSVLPRWNGADTDGTMDLGYYDGTTTNRWKDLYLSGGVYLGGTGAANKLDDYEEGSGTIVVTGSSGGTAATSGNYEYTKIGNSVSVQFEFNCTSISGVTGYLRAALPFIGTNYAAGSVRLYNVTFDGSAFIGVDSNSAFLNFKASKTGAATTNILSTGFYYGEITYRTA